MIHSECTKYLEYMQKDYNEITKIKIVLFSIAKAVISMI